MVFNQEFVFPLKTVRLFCTHEDGKLIKYQAVIG